MNTARRLPARSAKRSTGGSPPQSAQPAPNAPHWTFLSNHAHVLILLAQDQTLVLREVAARVGITERAVQKIIADLAEDGYLEREKVGRQNCYRIRPRRPLRHPIESHRSVDDLLALIARK